MEYIPSPHESELPDDPEDLVTVEVAVDEISFFLTKYNTEIYLFKEKYRSFNHIYHEMPDGRCFYLFIDTPNMQSLMDTLYEREFSTSYIGTKPSSQDLEAYYEYQDSLLEEELKDLLR